MIHRLLLVLALTSLSSLASAQAFTFTAIPDEDESRLRSRFNQVADYLSRELGVEVRYIPVKSYPAAISAFRNNQVQLAWFGGLSGVQARKLVPGSQALAQGAEDLKFKSYIIAHSSTGLDFDSAFPQGIAGLSFSFGSKGSTSGRLMPEYFIKQNTQKTPQQLFKRVGFSGDHSRTIALVQAGSYQAGALNYQVWENELKAGRIDLDQVKVIWQSPEYTDYQWTIRGDADQQWGAGFTAKVKQALLQMNDAKLLQAFPRKAFVEASNDDYAAIEAVAKDIGLID